MKGLNPGQPILMAKDLGRRFGDRTILSGASFSLAPGDRVGVLGVNGVGKSTMMRIIARRDREYDGQLVIAKGATVGYVSQEPELDFDKTVRDNVEEAVGEIRTLLSRYDQILKSWEDPEILADEEKTNALLTATPWIPPPSMPGSRRRWTRSASRPATASSARSRAASAAASRSARSCSPIPTS
jgi:ATPase subunit of ABC transporter with duplicated ATPase domains